MSIAHILEEWGLCSHRLCNLRARAALALKSPLGVRPLAAFLYGIPPGRVLTVDHRARTFRVAPGVANVPLSRLLPREVTPDLANAALIQRFATYSHSVGKPWTIFDLMLDSDEVCDLAQIGKRARDAISSRNIFLPTDVTREIADRADILLLALAGDVLGPQHSWARNTIAAIQKSGDPVASRAQWIQLVLDTLSWQIRAENIMPILDTIVGTATKLAPRARFAMRIRIAEALKNGF